MAQCASLIATYGLGRMPASAYQSRCQRSLTIGRALQDAWSIDIDLVGFPLCFLEEMISLGFHHLRGVECPQEIFTLSDGYSVCPRPCSRSAADELIK